MSYTEEKEDSCIKVNIKRCRLSSVVCIKDEEKEKWLRQVEGGSASKIEKGAWLIEADQSQIEINLDQSSKPFYYE